MAPPPTTILTKRRAPFGCTLPSSKRLHLVTSPPQISTSLSRRCALPPPCISPSLAPSSPRSETCTNRAPAPPHACYFCRSKPLVVACSRCDHVVCEPCARACSACFAAVCRYCTVVDYSLRDEVEMCVDCHEDGPEEREDRRF